MSLKRQVASGVFWVAFAQLAGTVLSLITPLILAKFLAPGLFGLVGMASLAINALQFLQDIGFDAALIYRRGDVGEASHTAFITVIVSSFAVYFIAALGAPAVAAFFREPAVVPVLRALALTAPIFSFGRVPYILLSRELNFRRKIFPELTANVLGNGIAIVLALLGVGVWSLVWGQLVRAALATMLVWLVTTWRPRLRFSWQLARELFNYGKHIVSSQTLIFFITNVDNAVVGRYAGQAALGQYQLAYNLSNRPATQITTILSQVMFPAFSMLTGESAGQARARYYWTTFRYVAWITVPIAVATILYAPAFTYGLYGDVWAPMILPLQCLAIYGLIRALAANMGSIFRAMGKPQWLTYIAAWRLATMLVTLYPVTKRWGISGVGVLSAIVAVVDFVISASMVKRLVEAPWRWYLRLLAPATAAALASGFVTYQLYPHLGSGKASIRLVAIGVLLVMLYTLLLWLGDRNFRAAVQMGIRQARRWWQQRQVDHLAGVQP